MYDTFDNKDSCINKAVDETIGISTRHISNLTKTDYLHPLRLINVCTICEVFEIDIVSFLYKYISSDDININKVKELPAFKNFIIKESITTIVIKRDYNGKYYVYFMYQVTIHKGILEIHANEAVLEIKFKNDGTCKYFKGEFRVLGKICCINIF